MSNGEASIVVHVACGYRCRANMEHMRQSRPDSGLGFEVKVLETPFELFFLRSEQKGDNSRSRAKRGRPFTNRFGAVRERRGEVLARRARSVLTNG